MTATPNIPMLQESIRGRNHCPWCLVAVRNDGTGGMEPFLLNDVFWHKGCVADQYRTELESQRP